MRPTRLTTKFTLCAALGLALSAGMLATSARAAEEGESLENKIFRNILEGIGLRKDGEAINYTERPPLVIPPARDLPVPDKGDAAIANNPAWPKDPDVSRRREEARLERNRNVSDEREREQNRLSEKELTPGGNPRTPPSRNRVSRAYGSMVDERGDRMTPSELGYKGGLFGNMFGGGGDEELAKFTGERPRSMLTDPPPGYQTPSPDQPYGLVGGDKDKSKAFNYLRDRSDPSVTR